MSTSTNHKKKVSFGANSYKYNVLEMDEPEDKDAMWYNRDYVQAIVKKLTGIDQENKSNDDDDDDDDICSCLTEESRRRRMNHVHSVLAMQTEIEEMGVKDITGLRAFASALSKEEVKSARERATQGAKTAFSVYAQSTGWMKGVTVKDFARQTYPPRVTTVTGKRKNTESIRNAINKEALRIVWAM
jgi:hypothetical protein